MAGAEIARQDNGLNERQYRFVHEYLKDFNATAAYVRAGYSPNGARASASALLARSNIQAALVRAREEIAERTMVNKEFVMAGLRENLERAMQQKPVYDKEGNPTGEYTWNGQVANKSLELMGKELGMFGDKLEVSGGPDPIKTFTIVKHIREGDG